MLRLIYQRTLLADYKLLAGFAARFCDHMDDQAAKDNPPADFNKIDLAQLQGFSFGTQWTQDKSAPGGDHRGGERPRREDRRDGPGGDPRRDRRSFQRPAGGGFPSGAPAGGGAAPTDGAGRGDPRGPAGGGDRRPRQGGGEGFRGGPRRDGPGGGAGGGYNRGERFERAEPVQRGPYESPFFNVTFYPEDTSFNALAKTIRNSCRTIELFEIARTVVGKMDRFVVVVTRKTPEGQGAPAGKPAPLYLSVPDSIPFETEEQAIAHVLSTHLGQFFDAAEAQVDPPKGNFQVINKCTITGELLGPPNYHRYNQIVQQHHAAKIKGISLEAYRGRIETVRDPEVVAQWLEKMKKTTRYTWKIGRPEAAAAQPAAATEAPAAAPAEGAPAEAAAPVDAAPAAEPVPVLAFDSIEEARSHLLTNARDKVVRAVDGARFHGKIAEALPPGEIRRATEGALERQRRFPLDTANALRGRLRREGFTIFKKGSKGVSYVCAVKRKFRSPGQTFSDSIGGVISFIESHPMIKASELATKFLGLAPVPVAPAAVEGQPAAEAAPAPELTSDQRSKLSRMQGDLRWLVTEGYVTEFIDGRLFAPPAMVEARKKEVEAEEHDPENFPDAPPADTPAPAAAPAPVEAAPSESAAPVADAAPVPATDTPSEPSATT